MTARIIVADGNPTTRITLKVRLAAACYHVAVARDAAQVLEMMRDFQPDLLILGRDLPDARPSDICAAIMAAPDTATVPVVMLASATDRGDALNSGAAAVLDPNINDQMLLARIRGLLRDCDLPRGMAEHGAGFQHHNPSVTLVGDCVARALRWRQMLAGELPWRFTIATPDETLQTAASGDTTDLYLIAAEIDGRSHGLRLLSELRSRPGSRHSAFVIATPPERDDLAAIALDLGAGDVVDLDWPRSRDTAVALRRQLGRKTSNDHRRAEAARDREWAMTDPLTGLRNRRYALPGLVQMVQSATQRVAVLVVDLDHFKLVNDRYGHAAGDQVLVEIARRIDATAGRRALTARLGGEEFLIAMPDVTPAQALQLAETLRHAVGGRAVDLAPGSGGGRIHVTLSIGVALCDHHPDAQQAVDAVVEQADQALRLAKSLGRNQVRVSNSKCAA
ncbi:diguanylate cyclase [Paracoccus sp. (in: a-proteobacteria)]|uniref:diguanylate cyclase domain-containing protein n=1 Tax=Paracoccus sp. TaxID=267 RepID=UPI0026DEE4D3|nr:diguanylate cyclase [Paracoccus sp. (in: a-proteobacteria)]MDO5646377.1 diguanylate cyclase [Paracoccus sp. (in: a-proteobacteria)]